MSLATPKQDVWLRQRYSDKSDGRLSNTSSIGKCPVTGARPSTEPVGYTEKTDAGGCPLGTPDPTAPRGEYYHTYLGLDKILDAQHPASGRQMISWHESFIKEGAPSDADSSNEDDNTNNDEATKRVTPAASPNASPSQSKSKWPQSRKEPAHDELFFIITHQTYELWFKQILHELNSVHKIFSDDFVHDSDLELCCHRLHRVTKIQEILVNQIGVLETMTPMEFLDFRDYLAPASGFQSWQFRVIELTLGLPIEGRKYGSESFLMGVLHGEEKERIQELRDSKRPSLNQLVEKWLERIPLGSYDFWKEYQEAVDNMIEKDEEIIRALVPEDRQEAELKGLKAVRSNFASLLDSKIHKEMMDRKLRKWSQKATLAALFITLYRTEPMLAGPFRLLNLLTEIDEHFCTWRLRHAAMAHRMIGMKIGTGGTSGVEYLNKAATENKAFKDLWQLATYLLPTSALPPLPNELKERLSFYHNVSASRGAGSSVHEPIPEEGDISSPEAGKKKTFSPGKR